MVDLGRRATYFSTSLACMPSTLKLNTYLYFGGAGPPDGKADAKGHAAARARRVSEDNMVRRDLGGYEGEHCKGEAADEEERVADIKYLGKAPLALCPSGTT